MHQDLGSTPRPNTRMRILAACRALFNERSPADVTTAQIAATVGINEGNLYYHFNRKEQILEALFGEFERGLREVAAADLTQSDHPAHYSGYLSGWFSLMWEWRFFYRDSALIFRLAPSLRPKVQALSDHGQEQIRRVLGNRRKAGLLRATDEEIERLIVNAWIVSTYWIDYLRSRHGVEDITREQLDWGASQIVSLFRPYLTAAGLELFDIKPDSDTPALPD
jgi:AcrR family transcriptional regulator